MTTIVLVDGADLTFSFLSLSLLIQWNTAIGILGVTYRLAQGVIKHIIPAVASTNAVVAAACALEVFKLASSCAPKLDNYMVFNDTDGENLLMFLLFLWLQISCRCGFKFENILTLFIVECFVKEYGGGGGSSLLFSGHYALWLPLDLILLFLLVFSFLFLFLILRFSIPVVVDEYFYFSLFFAVPSAGIYTYTYTAERNENCVACSQIPKDLVFHENARLSEVMEHLSTVYQMKGPGVTTTDKQGRNRTLYLPSVSSIEERTRPNLKKTLKGSTASYLVHHNTTSSVFLQQLDNVYL